MENYKHIVQYYETDKMGITHHSNYIRFMEEARVYFLNNLGWGYDKFEKDGVVSPVISISCDYKKTTTFADQIQIAVNVIDTTHVKLKLGYTMTVNDTVVCTGESAHCFLSKAGRPISIQKHYPEFYAELLRFTNV